MTKIYVIMKPLEAIEGVADDEVMVFVVHEFEDGDSCLLPEYNEFIAQQVFDKYYLLLEESNKESDE